jgi:NADH dehydrogenase
VKAADSLTRLGVTVRTGTLVTNIADNIVTVRQGEHTEHIPSQTVLWAAGVKASTLGQVLASRTGAALDRVGRVIVKPDLTVPDYANIFVIGDLAHCADLNHQPLPGIAPVAMQEGEYVAKLIKRSLQGESLPPFTYTDAGSLAVIGQNAAVVRVGSLKFSGILAWLIWAFAHIYYLIEYDNKLIVMLQWSWNYFTRKRGARLITGEASLVQVEVDADGHYRAPTPTQQEQAISPLS